MSRFQPDEVFKALDIASRTLSTKDSNGTIAAARKYLDFMAEMTGRQAPSPANPSRIVTRSQV